MVVGIVTSTETVENIAELLFTFKVLLMFALEGFESSVVREEGFVESYGSCQLEVSGSTLRKHTRFLLLFEGSCRQRFCMVDNVYLRGLLGVIQS